MNVRKWLMLILCTVGFIKLASAAEMDLLLQKLVDKGVLTEGEAQQVLTETREEVQKQAVQTVNENVPGWVGNTTAKGDFRVRFQNSVVKPNQNEEQDLLRLRLRYGLDYKVNDLTKIGFRLATGSDNNPTSTNQNLGTTFAKKAVWIDKAYAEFKAIPQYLTVTLGKFDNPYFATDMEWDTDYMPEGVLLQSSIPAGDNVKFFATLGWLPLGTQLNLENPFLVAPQAGLTAKIGPVPVKFGVTYYDFFRLKNDSNDALSTVQANIAPNNTGRLTNTFDKVGGANKWHYDYTTWALNLEVTPYEIPAGEKTIPIKVYGDFLKNTASGVSQDQGWLAGLKLGGLANKGDWEVGYNWRVLEADAIPCFLPDSDPNLGGTNQKGGKLWASYNILKNTTLTATYFQFQDLKDPVSINPWATNPKQKRDLFQVDCVMKF